MQDQQNQAGSGNTPDGPNAQQNQGSQDGGTLPYAASGETSASGRKGGEAGGNAGSTDTSDYGTDSSVDTQEVIGIGSANEDYDEAGGDATDDISRASDEDSDEE